MMPLTTLPSVRQARNSEQSLLPILQDEIRAAGRISFDRFMELCLYHPQLGYYNSGDLRLGKAGDYYTSAHVAPVFARLLARHLERSWRARGEQPSFELIELGPGDGLLASELLSWMARRYPELFSCLHYTGVEQSEYLRKRLEEVLMPFADRSRIVADWDRVLPFTAIRAATGSRGPRHIPMCWGGGRERGRVSTSPADTHRTQSSQRFVLANEFFDALPFHLLVWRDGAWKERYVCLEAGRLAWCEGDPSSPELSRQAESRFAPGLPLSEREDGWIAEITPRAAEWMKRISEFLSHGEALIIDYGYTLEEWQQGRFPRGTALAYRRHQAIDDVLASPGDQDITAHVNFSQLIEVGKSAGMVLQCIESQVRFLMQLGEEDQFREIFENCGSELERLRRAQLLKTLILPQGMGETFRVLGMARS